MNICKGLDTCEFFKVFQNEEERQLALKGFVRMYCKGERQNECVRKKIKEKYGKEMVPVNMMPNGYQLPRTSQLLWPEEIKKFITIMNHY